MFTKEPKINKNCTQEYLDVLSLLCIMQLRLQILIVHILSVYPCSR
jgi:hypothetical protein